MKRFLFVPVLALGLFVASCSDDSMLNSPNSSSVNDAGTQAYLDGTSDMPGNTIVDIAVSDPNFSVLVEAVVFAGLDETLSKKRQFTVFAPTNDAFVNLLNTLGIEKEQLFVQENKELVKKILLYHVAPGERFAMDVVTAERIRTMSKDFAMVHVNGGAFIGNDKYGYAEIVQTDIDASNGVIHVLDAVILPPSLDLYETSYNENEVKKNPANMRVNTIVDIAVSNPDFSVLVEAVVFAGLDGTLSGNRQFTVFAPTNDAFVDLLNALGITKEDLFVPENKELVKKILLYHVAPGERFAEDVVSSDRVRTMAGEFAMINVDGGAFIGNDTYGYAEIVQTDIDASNGVIHVLDAVILPPSLEL